MAVQKEVLMARRFNGNMKDERYLANTSSSKLEVHDLDNEKTNCQIDSIISIVRGRAKLL